MGKDGLFKIPKDFELNLQRFAEDANDAGGEQDADVDTPDLQKALEENLSTMNDLIKAKKDKLSDKDIEEMMKDKDNRNKVKEYMKKSTKAKAEKEDDDEDEEEEDIEKAFKDIDSNADVVDAVPILKSFKDIQKNLLKKVSEVNVKLETLQKSIEENAEFNKSFAGVLTSQADLIKSINEEVEVIAGQPFPRKGKINKEDIIKSDLENEEGHKKVSVNKVRDILMKSYEDGKIEMSEVARWEQSNYNINVLRKSTLDIIDSNLDIK
jgi:hypothetical protein